MSQTLRGRPGGLGPFNNYVTLGGGGGQSEHDIVTGGRGRLYTAYVTLTFHLFLFALLTYLMSKVVQYLHLLPRRSDTQEEKRHVNTVPVRLTRAQTEAHKSLCLIMTGLLLQGISSYRQSTLDWNSNEDT